MNIQKIQVNRLNPADYNPRISLKAGDHEYEKLKRSIEEFGYVEPVIWNQRTGNIVGGHQRYSILCDLGRHEIDCVVVDLPDDRQKALNIALNKIQGDWDEGKLASLMAEFDASSFDVSLTGFDAPEVDALLNRFYSKESQQDDFEPETEKKKIAENGSPVTKAGDLYRLGDHLLLCADPAQEESYDRLLGDERAQCAVTAPPDDPKEYAKVGLDPWLKRTTDVVRHLTGRAGIVCWQASDMMKTGSAFIEPLSIHAHKMFAENAFRPLWIRVWKMGGNLPTLTSLQNASNKPAPSFDYVSAFAGDDPETYNDQEYSWVSAFAAHDCGFTTDRPKKENQHRANDPINNLKSVITPHYFRHNYVTLLYEAGIEPLIAMKIVGHTDYQTTANIYTHLGNKSLRRAAVDMRGVFDPRGKEIKAQARPEQGKVISWSGRFGKKQA